MQCIPSEDHIQRCIESQTALRYLEKSRFRNPVYIITGVKVVFGATAKSGKRFGIGAGMGVKINGAIHKSDVVPIGGGAETEFDREHRDLLSWEDSSDFVFAFRAIKVWSRETQERRQLLITLKER
jgi:hypothetical protein